MTFQLRGIVRVEICDFGFKYDYVSIRIRNAEMLDSPLDVIWLGMPTNNNKTPSRSMYVRFSWILLPSSSSEASWCDPPPARLPELSPPVEEHRIDGQPRLPRRHQVSRPSEEGGIGCYPICHPEVSNIVKESHGKLPVTDTRKVVG